MPGVLVRSVGMSASGSFDSWRATRMACQKTNRQTRGTNEDELISVGTGDFCSHLRATKLPDQDGEQKTGKALEDYCHAIEAGLAWRVEGLKGEGSVLDSCFPNLFLVLVEAESFPEGATYTALLPPLDNSACSLFLVP